MVHETAVIDPGAELGANVSIGPFCYVEADVKIGDGCRLGPHVSIMRYTELGANCRVHAGAVLGDLPQDTGFADGESHAKIGNGCLIREGVTIHRGSKPGTVTEVGDGCFLMAFSHLAHNVRLGDHVIVANGALLAGYVTVGERAFISGNVLIHQFVTIGRVAMLSGGAAITKDVPPFCIAESLTRNSIAGLNVVGMRRAGMTSEERLDVKRAFRTVYRSGLNVTQAIVELHAAFDAGVGLEFCRFIEQSKRGVCGFGDD